MAMRRALLSLGGFASRAAVQAGPSTTACLAPRALLVPSRAYSTEVAPVMPTAPTTYSGAYTAALKNPSPDIQYDDSNHQRFPVGDPAKRAFTYFVLTGGRFIYASAARLVVLKFILSMTASKDVLALASLEVGLDPLLDRTPVDADLCALRAGVDLGAIPLGNTVTVKWRGKPVFIRHRTPAEIATAAATNLAELRDPQTDAVRAQKPEWLVLVGVCTHLGCVPLANAGDYSGWFCPCHGSHYDVSGRIRKGPAPYNLEVPAYSFLTDTKVLVG